MQCDAKLSHQWLTADQFLFRAHHAATCAPRWWCTVHVARSSGVVVVVVAQDGPALPRRERREKHCGASDVQPVRSGATATTAAIIVTPAARRQEQIDSEAAWPSLPPMHSRPYSHHVWCASYEITTTQQVSALLSSFATSICLDPKDFYKQCKSSPRLQS